MLALVVPKMHNPETDIATEDVVLLKHVIDLATVEQCRWPAVLEAQALLQLLGQRDKVAKVRTCWWYSLCTGNSMNIHGSL